MNNTKKSKTIPTNITRKRCPRGERWDKKENRCKKRIIKQDIQKLRWRLLFTI